MTGDLAATIIPKSDQLNADDLIGGPITILVRDAYVREGQDQPCFIFYEGDNGKPYKPNKGMRRLLILAWKTDRSKDFIGRSMTLFRNPDVLWAGKPEGGIQISHLSHLAKEETHMITVRRGLRVPMTVKPLANRTQHQDNDASEAVDDGTDVADLLLGRIAACVTLDALHAFSANKGAVNRRNWLRDTNLELYDKVGEAFEARERELSSEGRSDDQHGDQFDGADAPPATPEEPPVWKAGADAHLARVNAATTPAELNQAIDEFTDQLIGLPEDVRMDIEAAEERAASRVTPVAGG